MGSSPRMRGTPAVAFCSHATSGLIPTYAGNTIWRAGRVQKLSGSSPRMRGTPARSVARLLWRGLIPTYAGNTPKPPARRAHYRAHPHVCGEHLNLRKPGVHIRGSSPRMRGTPEHHHDRQSSQGLIPTYAGNTWLGPYENRIFGAHPHVCGEHAA